MRHVPMLHTNAPEHLASGVGGVPRSDIRDHPIDGETSSPEEVAKDPSLRLEISFLIICRIEDSSPSTARTPGCQVRIRCGLSISKVVELIEDLRSDQGWTGRPLIKVRTRGSDPQQASSSVG